MYKCNSTVHQNSTSKQQTYKTSQALTHCMTFCPRNRDFTFSQPRRTYLSNFCTVSTAAAYCIHNVSRVKTTQNYQNTSRSDRIISKSKLPPFHKTSCIENRTGSNGIKKNHLFVVWKQLCWSLMVQIRVNTVWLNHSHCRCNHTLKHDTKKLTEQVQQYCSHKNTVHSYNSWCT